MLCRVLLGYTINAIKLSEITSSRTNFMIILRSNVVMINYLLFRIRRQNVESYCKSNYCQRREIILRDKRGVEQELA